MTEGMPHERVGLALDAVDRVVTILSRQRYVLELAVPALADARRWRLGEPIAARQIYDHVHPLMNRMTEDGLAGRELAAATAVVYALFYTAWHARQIEGPVGPPLPNDICEVSEETLKECLGYAEQAIRE